MSKRCDFHRNNGHTTEECVGLKNFLEDLARKGLLDRYILKGPEEDHRRRNTNAPQEARMVEQVIPIGGNIQEPIRGLVETIAGGFAGGGSSTSARKRSLRSVMNVTLREQDATTTRHPVISFTHEDYKGMNQNLDDPMVITLTTANYLVKRVLIDQGSSADIIFYSAFRKLCLNDNQLKPYSGVLVGFTGEQVRVRGYIDLRTTFGDQPKARSLDVRYLVVEAPSAYNIIIGRPALNALGAVVSTSHLAMKFPVSATEVGTIHADLKEARTCYNESLKIADPSRSSQEMREVKMTETSQGETVELDPRAELQGRPQPTDHLQQVIIGEDRNKVTNIADNLPRSMEEELIQLLRGNADLFAWVPADMPGIDPDFICHSLAIDPAIKPVAQRKRKLGEERQAAVTEECRKLLAAGFIREVQYTTWLSNVVMVRKSNGKWRMCTDFTDLNKACPKDPYPLPNIDRLVDGAAGYEFLSFMDAYSGYNQIRMNPADEDKTAFITEKASYCYKVMPFGLKNAGATYQRLMNKVFTDQIGRNVEVYVDDMVAKTPKGRSHCDDLTEIFSVLRKHQMKLNPEKCAFGVKGGKFLGFMITNRGIEANPEKCQAILDMKSPTSMKEVQKLTGRIAALSRFLARSADRSLHFFKILKKQTSFQWTEDCEAAFEELKSYLATPPTLTKSELGEKLFLYLSVSEQAISSALVSEREKEQKPIYFVSKILQGAEKRYQKIEQLALALIISARRLRQYFQCHHIVVRTDQPIRLVLQKPELAGRLVAWSVELSEHSIEYQPRGAIKSQVLADFIVELARKEDSTPPKQQWILYVDGASNLKGSGAGIILEGPNKLVIEQSLRFGFRASNNQAEYEALVAGLRLAKEVGARHLIVKSDSQLVANQVQGEFQAKDPQLGKYLEKVQTLMALFDKVQIEHIPREQNTRADILSKLASTKAPGNNKSVVQETLASPSIEEEEVGLITAQNSWQKPIWDFLKEQKLPDKEEEAKKVRRQAPYHTIVGNDLYKRGFSQPLLKCLDPTEADYVIREVHEGICGGHIGGRALAAKILRAGYFWPTMKTECLDFVKRCEKCQKFNHIQQKPSEHLHSLNSNWPFDKWGIDLLGPFPLGRGQVRFLVVAIDHFTKWIEAEPLATITSDKIIKFLWKNIICRFGIPNRLVSDNGTQFVDKKVRKFCDDLNIRQSFTSVEHPQTNGQTEAANKVVLNGLKKRLEKAKGLWPDELSSVLWSYNTTPQSSTLETPFRLTYGAEAVIPVEIGEPSLRIRNHEGDEEARRADLDLLDEEREIAQVREAAAKQRAARRYNKSVIFRDLTAGDLVLRKVEMQRKPPNEGKLAANWEGPFKIIQKLGKGAYRLAELNGRELPRSWNIQSLRKYFS